eukprot:225347-Chlamydomonas_euryale.AAC.1
MRMGVVKPLETRKFIVMSRQCLGNTEAEVIEVWTQSVAIEEERDREGVAQGIKAKAGAAG